MQIFLTKNVSINVYKLAACSKIVNGDANPQIVTLENKTRIYKVDKEREYPDELVHDLQPPYEIDHNKICLMMVSLIETYIDDGIFGAATLFETYLRSDHYIRTDLRPRKDGKYLYPLEHICCILINKLLFYKLIFADDLLFTFSNYVSRLSAFDMLKFYGIPSFSYLYDNDIFGFIAVYVDLLPANQRDGFIRTVCIPFDENGTRKKLDIMGFRNMLHF